MGAKFRTAFQSLGFRLVLPLFLTVGVVLTAHSTYSFRSTKESFVNFVRADVTRSSGLIQRATHDGMLLNLKDEVQATIERLAEDPEVAAIRVYDKEGAIIMSAHKQETGQRIEIDSDTCRSCHGEEATADTAVLERSSLTRVAGGPEVLRHLTVIENQPSCASADCHEHPSEQRVLGVLDVEMSMAPLYAAAHSARRQLFWTTLALIFIIGLVSAVSIRQMVYRPVSKLQEGTRRIANGELQTRIKVRGEHELAQLAKGFNQMAEDLSTARSEVTEWSEKLEEKVVEKTEELRVSQRQVLHMEKMSSLGKLSATVAHELNNPLSGILTYARLVRREIEEQPIDAEIREELARYLSLMEKECMRCGDIVRNLLLFTRRNGAEKAAVDINEIVERSLMLLRHHLEITGVTLESEIIDGDPVIIADAGQLQQALVALLVNAVEAMNSDGGGGTLSVRLQGGVDDVQIDIGDTGVGIPPEVLPQIFEPFFTTKETESGAGLGLAVVYGIVQRHGGDITIESDPELGTVFHLRLPRRPESGDVEASPTSEMQVPII
jgi:two-component system NtrC family sensor kinase